MAPSDITGLHHVGILVRDIAAAIEAFGRFGFRVGPPSYPALPPSPGASPEPVGAGNTHADFPGNFIELVALAPERRGDLPPGADLVPLQVPDEHLEATRAVVRRTVEGLTERLDHSEGAHVLVFASSDAERTAARLSGAGIDHSGAQPAQRPITTAEGTRLEPIKHLEINDGPAERPRMPPEGRVGFAEDAPREVLDAQTGLDHSNGATGLVECMLTVDAEALEPTVERYERYLGVPPTRDGVTRAIELGSGRLSFTTPSAYAARLPGEPSPEPPALCAYAVEVADLAACERLLDGRGVELGRTDSGEPFIPAASAYGAAIIMRQAANAA